MSNDTPNTDVIAAEIVDQMNDDDKAAIREAGDAEAWRDGVGQWPDAWTGMDIDDVLDAIYELVVGED